MKTSKYQEAVYAFVRGEPSYNNPDSGWSIDFGGKKNAVVEAVAGSGKTTTIVKSLDQLYVPVTAAQLAAAKGNDGGWTALFSGQRPKPKVLFAAFNKHIAEELQRRVPTFVKASTLNSEGWSACRANVPRVELDKFKDENILQTVTEKEHYYKAKGSTAKLIGLFKAMVYKTKEEVAENFVRVADFYDVAIPEIEGLDFMAKTLEVWKISVEHTRHMSFDDQVFQPIFQNWELPRYDWVFGDECQDWSPLDRKSTRLNSSH